MRKVTFGVANSLDNFIARDDHSVDWLLWSEDVAAFVQEFWKSVDTVLMGRKTYEAGARLGTTSYPGVANYVFSRTMQEAPDPAVQVIATDVVAFVRELKEQDGGDICVMGGGALANALFEADLIDEVGVNVHPVLLGSGVPLFSRMSRQIDLRLTECRQMKGGCVLLRYAVVRPADAA
jgi:dihydrofolate reductase